MSGWVKQGGDQKTHDTSKLEWVARPDLVDDGGNEQESVQHTGIDSCTHDRIDQASHDAHM
jgi:hypothetical protein